MNSFCLFGVKGFKMVFLVYFCYIY